MIDFANMKYIKMKQEDSYKKKVKDLIVPGEEVLGSYKAVRDGIIFTTKRIIVINVQGLTGKKVDYTSIPYARFNAYSIETSGVFDMDAELNIYVSGMGMMTFEFRGRSDIREISKFISQAII
ncbi:MAG: PH domain-containing protein [Candidatus Izimaplasma sp.]|nr:PH domain-containing protein [Candidatus Izimaplasma bacterium]